MQKMLGEGYYVNINMAIVDLVGSYEAAAILTRAIYWEGIAGGDFYKTNEEWIDELRLSDRRLTKAREQSQPFLQWERRGVPAKNYYWVDYDALLDALGGQLRQNVGSSIDKTSDLVTYKTSDLLTNTNNTSNNTSNSSSPEVASDSGEHKPTVIENIDTQAYQSVDKLDRLVEHVIDRPVKKKTQNQLDTAALAIDRLHRIDGRSYELIEGIMRWALQDSFWRNNIQSTDTLRKQFDKLYAKAKREAEREAQHVAVIS